MKNTENNKIFDLYLEQMSQQSPTAGNFEYAIEISLGRKNDPLSLRKEKTTIAEDIHTDFEASDYFSGYDINVQPYVDTIENNSAVLELTLSSEAELSVTEIQRVLAQGGVLRSSGYKTQVYEV